jgi:glycosyltransferase involved in cell wall biosynthesis
MKSRIINILPHPPAYEFIKGDARPEIYWEQAPGTWVGLFRGDWPDLLGEEVLKITDEFNYEFWRLDLRADKIYSHTFKNGLVQRIFPADKIKTRRGIKTAWDISSPHLLEYLQQNQENKIILHLNGLGELLNQEIIQLTSRVPKVIQFHSQLSHPYLEFKKIRKNILSNIGHYQKFLELRKNKHIFFVFCNSINAETLAKYHPLGIERISCGCDFEYWTPGDRAEARKDFSIPLHTKVLSVASRFVDLKQIDRLIALLTALDRGGDFDFKCIVAGHGDAAYVHHLKTIGQELAHKGKLIFSGFLDGEELRRLYRATDLFISSSRVEGVSVSVIKAIACETPVMVTRLGGVDDFLGEQGCGLLVRPMDYEEWKTQLELFLRGELIVSKCDRQQAKKVFHWPFIANRFLGIYRKLATFIE